MSQDTFTANLIEGAISGTFTTHHYLQADGVPLGELVLPSLRSTGTFTFATGRELTMHLSSLWRGRYELHEGEELLGTAVPRGFFRRNIIVTMGDQGYALSPPKSLSSDWWMLDAEGTEMFCVRRQGLVRLRVTIEIAAPVSADLIVFGYYLVYKHWQEEHAILA